MGLTPLLVLLDDRLVRSPCGWARLGHHARDVPSDRATAVLRQVAELCDELRAALLAPDEDEDEDEEEAR